MAAQGKVEGEVGKPQSVGPQTNEPILPNLDVNCPNSRPPLQDLSKSDGLPTKLSLNKFLNNLSPQFLPFWFLWLVLKRENTSPKIFQIPQFRKKEA